MFLVQIKKLFSWFFWDLLFRKRVKCTKNRVRMINYRYVCSKKIFHDTREMPKLMYKDCETWARLYVAETDLLLVSLAILSSMSRGRACAASWSILYSATASGGTRTPTIPSRPLSIDYVRENRTEKCIWIVCMHKWAEVRNHVRELSVYWWCVNDHIGHWTLYRANSRYIFDTILKWEMVLGSCR